MIDKEEMAKITLTKKEAGMVMEMLIGIIKKTLKNREEIFISGFGTFTIVERKTRKGRNPKTGEAIRIAAKILPKFKPAKAFKEAVK